MEDDQINKYKEEGIFTLPFNEIEMLFLTESVIISVLKNVFPAEEVQERVIEFQKRFFEIISKEKSNIVQQKMKKHMDNQLSNYRINSTQPSGVMVEEVKSWLLGLNLESLESESISKLERIIEEKSYDDLLKICPQKKEISKGLANRLLDSDFEHKAQNRLKIDSQLAIDIRTTYFSEMIFEE